MNASFVSVRVAGGLLPADVLSAVLAGTLDGVDSGAYHLAGESPREAAARVWTHLLGVYRRLRDDLARLPEGDPAGEYRLESGRRRKGVPVDFRSSRVVHEICTGDRAELVRELEAALVGKQELGGALVSEAGPIRAPRNQLAGERNGRD